MRVDISSSIEGIIGDAIWYHFDCDNDVLYLRLASARGMELYGEETPEGFTLLRTDTGQAAGMTIVGYWRRFGRGKPKSASVSDISQGIEQFASSHDLAA